MNFDLKNIIISSNHEILFSLYSVFLLLSSPKRYCSQFPLFLICFFKGQNLVYVDLTYAADNQATYQFMTLTNAINYVIANMNSATIVLMSNQQIIDLSGKVTVSKPLNIT